LVVFDQHAVHERILFEKALEGLVKSEFPSQQLLFPRLIEFAIGEESSFEELLPFLLNFGFEIKPFGPRTYLVEAVPAGLKISDEAELLRQVLDYYRENDEKWEQASQKAAAAFACKAAIKADEVLTPEEMVGLIEALFRANVTFACPHGRPTYIKIDLEELDRRFGRG
jgi:DNA mismatch repair protein MutL